MEDYGIGDNGGGFKEIIQFLRGNKGSVWSWSSIWKFWN
jgi:hypothetical protein